MAQPSTIGRGTTIRGNIRGDGDLDIQGRVDGSVEVQGELTIGEAALIKSDVSGRRVVVSGAVAGNVFADEAVILERGARVVGDLAAPRIGIRPGALVRGHVSTGARDASTGVRSRAAATRAETRGNARPAAAARPAAPATKAAAVPAATKSSDGVGRNANSAAKTAPRAAPPPPIVPSLKKGAKGSLKRKAAR